MQRHQDSVWDIHFNRRHRSSISSSFQNYLPASVLTTTSLILLSSNYCSSIVMMKQHSNIRNTTADPRISFTEKMLRPDCFCSPIMEIESKLSSYSTRFSSQDTFSSGERSSDLQLRRSYTQGCLRSSFSAETVTKSRLRERLIASPDSLSLDLVFLFPEELLEWMIDSLTDLLGSVLNLATELESEKDRTEFSRFCLVFSTKIRYSTSRSSPIVCFWLNLVCPLLLKSSRRGWLLILIQPTGLKPTVSRTSLYWHAFVLSAPVMQKLREASISSRIFCPCARWIGSLVSSNFCTPEWWRFYPCRAEP